MPAVKNNCEPRANFSQNTRPDSRNRVIPTDYQLRRATGALTGPGHPTPGLCKAGKITYENVPHEEPPS